MIKYPKVIAGLSLAAALYAPLISADEDAWLSTTLEVTGGLDYNVGNGAKHRDKVEDHFGEAVLTVGHEFFITEYHAVNLQLDMNTRQFKDINGLDHWGGGGEIAYFMQPGRHFYTPVIQVNASLHEEVYNPDQRSNRLTKGQLVIMERMSDRISANTGIEYSQRDANAEIFDLEEYRAFFALDLMLTQNITLYGAFSFIRGDITSSAQVQFCNGALATDIYDLVNNAHAIATDKALSEAFCGTWLTYKLEADTQTYRTGINYALSHDWSLDISGLYAHARVNADAGTLYGNIDYERAVFLISLFAGF
ncbi:MAG: hypothetical protein H7A00_03260 [Hahellaceae bacterium]|nr:hypothetical protein [Hahellaceae bacterium]